MSQQALESAREISPEFPITLAKAIRRSVERLEWLELALVVAPYLVAIVLPVVLVSMGRLPLVWGLALAVLLSVGAAQAHAWATGSLRPWLRPRLLHRARAGLHQFLAELGANSALVHSWSAQDLGAVAITDTHLLVADRATGFAPRAIAYADIVKVQLLRGTKPNTLVVFHVTPKRQTIRQYLLFPETIIAEMWSRELQTRLPQPVD